MSSFTLKQYIHYLPSQEMVGCCTSSACLLAVEMNAAMKGRILRFSRLFVYYMTRKLQNRIGQEGAELQETLKAMILYGMAPDSIWPFSYNRVNEEPSLSVTNEACKYKIQSYQTVTPKEFKNYLINGNPIIIGLHTGRLFWKLKDPLELQLYKPINDTDNRPYKGHALVIIGYNDSIKAWILANSLGIKWGDNGYGILPYSCEHDIGEAYIINENIP